MLAPVILAVVASIAGHPVQVACDADTNPSPTPTPTGEIASAWTIPGGNVIHVLPVFCDATASAKPGTVSFAHVLEIFIHEAAHARGARSETCAEMMADIGIYQVLRDFYGIPFFSDLSEKIGAQVLALTRTLVQSYQPEACWSNGPF